MNDAAHAVSARLISRVLRDLGRERGFAFDEVAWLPDPSQQNAQTYTLVVAWNGRTQRQIFLRDDLEQATESDTMRARILTILKSFLDGFE